MSKKKLQYYKPLPGSNKQRNRARNRLECVSNGDGSWTVSGGETPHVVMQIGTELSCDCNIFAKENKLCSHIIKVEMALGIFPESKLETK